MTTTRKPSDGFPYSRKCRRRSARDPRPAAARLEILGHDAVGPVHLRRDVPRPGRGHRLLCAAAGRIVRRRRSDPCRRRRPDHLALGHPGIAGRAAGDVDRDPSNADTVCRLSGAALDLMAQFLHRRRRAGHPGRRLGPAVAGARARGDAGLHGRRAEIRAGRRRAVAAGDRVLRRRADVGRDILARGFLYRGWSESKLGVAGAIFLSSLAWTSLHLQYDWFFFGEVFSIGLLLGYLRYRTNSTWLTIVLHGINNLGRDAFRRSGWRGVG